MSIEDVTKIIKSCIVSRKGGVPMNEIDDDYRELVGHSIPYVTLGYRHLQDFIHSIDFVTVKTSFLGDSILFVSDPKVAHIDSLVSKQKNSSNHNVGSKRNKKNRGRNSRQAKNKSVTDNRTPSSRPRSYYIKSTDNNRPETFRGNTRMEYTKSKWYSDRQKDSWKIQSHENRKLNRYNNFNVGRISMGNSSDNSTMLNEHSWSSKSASSDSVEENMYNFRSIEEKRYAQTSRSWRFPLQVADDAHSTEFVLEPLINGNQLIGDDFFLKLALKNLRAETRKPRVGAAIRCGLCISGQTIDECRQRLEKTKFLSSSVAILLGAVDIFRGHSLEKMVSDMKKLLDVCKNRFKLSEITLCTIPPLANYSVRFNLRKLSVLYSFNNWINLHSNFRPDDSYIHHYNVIDLFSRFTDCNHRTLYDFFEIDARMVSGCSYPHVLWNTKGSRAAISMLEKSRMSLSTRV